VIRFIGFILGIVAMLIITLLKCLDMRPR